MSGIYIPGISMPKENEHPFWVSIHADGTIEYNENKGYGWQVSKSILVPDHGRLIDGDALLNEKGIGTQIAGWGKMYHETCIEYAPTIIPASKEGEG